MKFNPFQRKPVIPNEDLLKAITAVAANPTPQTKRRMYEAILNSQLLMANESETDPAPILLETEDGQVVLPVFSDIERLRKVFPDAKRAGAMPARQLCALALQYDIDIININPAHGPGGDLERYELEALAEERIPDTSSAAGRKLGDPAFVPMGSSKLPTEKVMEALTTKAQSMLMAEASVREAYLILMKSEAGDSRLTVAVLFDSIAKDDRKSAFSQQLVHTLEKVADRPIGIVWLDTENLKMIQARQEPIYKRGS